MFVWRDFKEDGKFRREKWRERSFKGCLVGRGSGKKWVGLGVFSPGPPKSFLPKMRRKLGGEAH